MSIVGISGNVYRKTRVYELVTGYMFGSLFFVVVKDSYMVQGR